MTQPVYDMDHRISRALELGGGNRAKAALLLDRWAGVMRANDPTVAVALKRSAQRLLRREFVVNGASPALRALKDRKSRLRSMGL